MLGTLIFRLNGESHSSSCVPLLFLCPYPSSLDPPVFPKLDLHFHNPLRLRHKAARSLHGLHWPVHINQSRVLQSASLPSKHVPVSRGWSSASQSNPGWIKSKFYNFGRVLQNMRLPHSWSQFLIQREQEKKALRYRSHCLYVLAS